MKSWEEAQGEKMCENKQELDKKVFSLLLPFNVFIKQALSQEVFSNRIPPDSNLDVNRQKRRV